LLSKAHQGQGMQTIISVSSGLLLFNNKKRDKLQNIHRWHIRYADVMMARDGSSILP